MWSTWHQLPVDTTSFGSITNDNLMSFRVNTPSSSGWKDSGPPEQVMPIAAFAILFPKARLLFRILGVLKQRPLSTVVERCQCKKHCVVCLFWYLTAQGKEKFFHQMKKKFLKIFFLKKLLWYLTINDTEITNLK